MTGITVIDVYVLHEWICTYSRECKYFKYIFKCVAYTFKVFLALLYNLQYLFVKNVIPQNWVFFIYRVLKIVLLIIGCFINKIDFLQCDINAYSYMFLKIYLNLVKGHSRWMNNFLLISLKKNSWDNKSCITKCLVSILAKKVNATRYLCVHIW